MKVELDIWWAGWRLFSWPGSVCEKCGEVFQRRLRVQVATRENFYCIGLDRTGRMSTYIQVVQFVLVVAPDGVVQIVPFANHTESLVCVVPLELLVVFSFRERKSPEFYVDVLVSGCFGLLESFRGQRDGYAVKVIARLHVYE